LSNFSEVKAFIIKEEFSSNFKKIGIFSIFSFSSSFLKFLDLLLLSDSSIKILSSFII